MNKTKHILLLGAIFTGSLAISHTVLAEISGKITGNIGVTSNYLWRGVTQTNDLSAVSGGIDFAHDSGFYAGTWTSNLGGGDQEVDLYAGYGMKAGPVDLDFGAISYQYPVNEAYFHEGYVNANFKMFNAGLAYTLGSDDNNIPAFINDNGDIYISLGATFEVKKGLEAGVTLGSYNFKDDVAEDYTHIQASLSKDDFTFAIDKNDLTDVNGEDNIRFSASWSKGFNL
ncbi:MAG: TorF family putative porin [Gammaproteobacteria bacterium]|nr:TorF family putative porin [Gammaproteobacteria bacterium]